MILSVLEAKKSQTSARTGSPLAPFKTGGRVLFQLQVAQVILGLWPQPLLSLPLFLQSPTPYGCLHTHFPFFFFWWGGCAGDGVQDLTHVYPCH
jgi:hypothetical protein